jgi:hypothetical protein
MGVRVAGIILIGVVLYWAVCSVVFFVAAIAYTRGVIIDLPWILAVQRHLYLDGGWNVWQSNQDCVTFDEQLLYKPKLGACQFDNLEFQTVLHFTPTGRRMRDIDSSGHAIAVIGDSFAMGWGVEDLQTFASELQRRTGRKVYNLAVSSYGTVRELIRLSQFPDLANVDTVIIQYCENDLAENMTFTPRWPAEARRKFAGITESRRSDAWSVITYFWRCYRRLLRYPIIALSQRIAGGPEPDDFGPHYTAMMNVIRDAPALRDKRVIIVYTRGYGVQFKNFPTGTDAQMQNVTFVDLQLEPSDFYVLDPHLNAHGQKRVGRQLAAVVRRNAEARRPAP